MATLVLTTVGTAIGGPLGGAIGALLGQSVDARLFAPKGRAGPRLTDLRIQTSSYATPIPQLFGRMRVAGTVIWATDLAEHRNRQSGGKGRPSTTTYSYSASFAVALSSRPIAAVDRIWAEGNILRGADGRFKSATGFRVHAGGEDQAADPLIAAAEGPDGACAYRGIAYVVFEDMDLAPFGNRIPSLSFEVDAGDPDLSLQSVTAVLLGGAEIAGPVTPIMGYAASGASRAEALSTLLPLLTVDRAPAAGGWRLGEAESVPVPLGEPASDRGAARSSARRGGAATAPGQVSVSAYDPARDHQLGLQQVRVASGRRAIEPRPERRIALPAAMAAADAKRLAAALAEDAAVAAPVIDWPAGFAALALPPGSRVQTRAGGGIQRIDERLIEGAGVRLTLVAERGSSGATAADGGRSVPGPDRTIGASIGHIVDLPARTAVVPPAARLMLAAGGAGAGWRRAAVALRAGPASPPVDIGTVEAAGAIGQVIAATGLTVGRLSSALLLRDGAIEVELAHAAMTLHDADDAQLLAGANMAMLGDELVQFGRATPLAGPSTPLAGPSTPLAGSGAPAAPARWRLERLLRGRLGTEDAMAAPLIGRRFALADDAALFLLPETVGLEAVTAGSVVQLIGVQDSDPVDIAIAATGRAVRPLSPVHGRARRTADGGLRLAWIRRSRGGFGWDDGADVPIDERQERYRLLLSAGGTSETVIIDAPMFDLSAAMVAAWAARGPLLTAAVSQMGERAASVPLQFSIALSAAL